jgi:uridylate kinase
MESKYKRVILKISGEALAGAAGHGIDPKMTSKVAEDVRKLVDMGVQVGIVVGGGNFWRGRTSPDMNQATADYMGMLATVINALGLQEAFEAKGIEARVLTALEIKAVAESYSRRRADSLLNRGIVVIFGAGTGSPYFTTDTAAALKAAEMEADVLLLAKNVDGVYDSDPVTNPDAVKFDRLTHTEVLQRNLKVMDSTAASLCRDNNITIHVFGLNEEDGIARACRGEEIGTIIS